jgi:hypothetical protein
MDQIVGDARMPRLALEDLLRIAAPGAGGIGLVAGRGADIERDGVEQLRFVVGGIALRHPSIALR